MSLSIDAPRDIEFCRPELESPDDEDTVVEEDITTYRRTELEYHATQASPSSAQETNPANILVAISSKEERHRYANAFRSAGYRASEATDGLSCLSALRSEAFDMLVVDRHLLWGSGDGVVEVMHHDPLIDQVPVVLLSYSSPDDSAGGSASRKREFGCDEIIHIVQERLAGNI